jgi:hypothetical protein
MFEIEIATAIFGSKYITNSNPWKKLLNFFQTSISYYDGEVCLLLWRHVQKSQSITW